MKYFDSRKAMIKHIFLIILGLFLFVEAHLQAQMIYHHPSSLEQSGNPSTLLLIATSQCLGCAQSVIDFGRTAG